MLPLLPLLPLLLVLTGCGNKAAPAAVVCKAATTQSCSCDHALPGIQICAPDGFSWEACDCSPPHDAGPCEDATGNSASGCWDGAACHSGTEAPYCGSLGRACATCQERNQCQVYACSSGLCVNQSLRDGTACDGGDGYPHICYMGACHNCGPGTLSCDYDAGP